MRTKCKYVACVWYVDVGGVGVLIPRFLLVE